MEWKREPVWRWERETRWATLLARAWGKEMQWATSLPPE
jgi:hypothetical protein